MDKIRPRGGSGKLRAGMRLNHIRRGEGEPLLLVHGIGDSHATWTRVIGRLARHHTVYAIDVPGFGRSAPLDEEPTVPALAAAVRAFMGEHGYDDFHVAGSSMGGGIALELARARAVRSATALSPIGFAVGWEQVYARVTLMATRALAERLAPAGPRLTRSVLARRLLAAEMVADGAHYSPDELAVALSGLAAAPGFRRALGPVSTHEVPAGTRFACPVTIAWGDRDRLLLYRPQSARARERLPEARHVTLERCGHLPMWDDPAGTARVIVETSRPAGR